METIKGESSDSIIADGDQWIWRTAYRDIKRKFYFKIELTNFKVQSLCIGSCKGIVNIMARRIIKKVLSVEQDEGVGARVRRSVGRAEVSIPDSFDVKNVIRFHFYIPLVIKYKCNYQSCVLISSCVILHKLVQRQYTVR